MPELAEVEYYRKLWNPGLEQKVLRVLLHPNAKVFRGTDTGQLEKRLQGATFLSSASAAKQMLFRFSGSAWLGLHLGMTGKLVLAAPEYEPGKHDHLVLQEEKHALVFSDFRTFGRVQFSLGDEPPNWWTAIAPPIVSKAFTVSALAEFFRRRARTPIKAVLLMQERFPGIGNWMADEILWRAAVHPKQLAGTLTEAQVTDLHRECRWVCRQALKTIGETLGQPPKTWLFPHRWEDGGRCPKTGALLKREEVGGRTTCWSPARQKMKRDSGSVKG